MLASADQPGAALADRRASKLFADWGQLRQVLSVVIPTAVYVALVPLDRASTSRRSC